MTNNGTGWLSAFHKTRPVPILSHKRTAGGGNGKQGKPNRSVNFNHVKRQTSGWRVATQRPYYDRKGNWTAMRDGETEQLAFRVSGPGYALK